MEKTKADILQMRTDNESMREQLSGLTAKLFDYSEENKKILMKMELDRNRQVMFLTSLLLAQQDGKGDPKKTMELIKSKISSVIHNHEQSLNNDDSFGCSNHGGN